MSPSIRRDDAGAVYVEYLLAFPPIFFLFLGMVQVALLYVGDLAVRHAANTAARAAIVVLDDDPRCYGGTQRQVVRGGGGRGGSPESMSALLETLGLRGGGGAGSGSGIGNARYDDIRSAAQIPLLGLSPSMETLSGTESVYRAIGGKPEDRAMTGAAMYNRFAVAVTFPERPGASGFQDRFREDENVTVRVTYLFHCSVPLASMVLCEDYSTLSGAGVSPAGARRLLGRGEEGARRLRERYGTEAGSTAELQYAEAPHLGFATVGAGARFRALQAEATMPNQSAGYDYPRRGGCP